MSAEQKILGLEKANAEAPIESSKIVKKIDVLEEELKNLVNENKGMEKSKKTLEDKVRTLLTWKF